MREQPHQQALHSFIQLQSAWTRIGRHAEQHNNCSSYFEMGTMGRSFAWSATGTGYRCTTLQLVST
jgi:hypothetical protein